MKAVTILLLFVATIFLVARSSSDSNNGTNPPANGSADRVDISMQNTAFVPDQVTINVGDTIVWTNNDAIIHTATSTSGTSSFDSGNMNSGETFTVVFTQAGVTNYRCEIHPAVMTGLITVEP